MEDETVPYGERIAAALERIAGYGDDASRLATMEDLLKDFVRVMERPDATDGDWAQLLDDVKEVLLES